MEADQIYEVVTKLIGNIRPQGCSQRDKESNENLKKFIQVFDKMHLDIDFIADNYKKCHESSIKKAVKIANDHLDSMGIE